MCNCTHKKAKLCALAMLFAHAFIPELNSRACLSAAGAAILIPAVAIPIAVLAFLI